MLSIAMIVASGFMPTWVRPATMTRPGSVAHAGSVQMLVRSKSVAFDDGTPLGLLERDAKAVFSMLDENSDGEITKAELQTRLLSYGYTEDRIETVFGKIDTNGDDVLSQEEFGDAYVQYPTLRTAPGLGGALKEKLNADADAVFDMLDANKDGTVEEKELVDYLVNGCGYADDLPATILKAVDFDKSGEVDRDEFRKAFIIHPSLRTAKGLGGAPCDAIKEE